LSEPHPGRTVKSVALVAVPPAFVTLIRPIVAPRGTVTRMLVEETTVIGLAFVRLNRTAVTFERFLPLIVTVVPTRPLVGVKELIDGAGDTTTKFTALVAVPAGPVTLILPLVAAAGVVALIWVGESTVNVAVAAPNLTADTPVKLVPVILTLVPTPPLVGVKDVIVGAEPMTKLVELVPVPPGARTVIGPLTAPAGTVATI
jgi:hypothetical protein